MSVVNRRNTKGFATRLRLQECFEGGNHLSEYYESGATAMNSNGHKRKGPFMANIVGIFSLAAGIFLAMPSLSQSRPRQDVAEAQNGPVPKGKEPVDVAATVIAMSREP